MNRYNKDSFYFSITENQWCWKQTSTGKIFKAKTKTELLNIKEKEFIGSGNYASRVLIPAFSKVGTNFHSIVSNSAFNAEFLSKKYKISRERIRQIETKAFEKLQKSMINASKSKNLLPLS